MLERLVENFAFFKIVLSPLVIGAVIGFILFNYFEQNETGSLLFGGFTLAGLITGIVWAVQITKKQKAIDFIAKKDESPDITEVVKKKK